MTQPELQLPLPGPDKGYCEGEQDRCTGDVCPVYGRLAKPSRDGRRRVFGCDDPSASNKRARAKGDRRERGVAKKLLATRTTRHEELRGGPIRYESKAGGKAKTVQTAYRNSRAQSDAARAVGDNRPFIAAFAPDGDGHEYLVIRDDELMGVAFAIVEATGVSPPVCAFSDRKLDTDREFFRWRCKLCGRKVHVVCGRVRAHKMPGLG